MTKEDFIDKRLTVERNRKTSHHARMPPPCNSERLEFLLCNRMQTKDLRKVLGGLELPQVGGGVGLEQQVSEGLKQ